MAFVKPLEIGQYVSVTGRLQLIVEKIAGNGPYLIQSMRFYEFENNGGEVAVIRIAGSIGTMAVLYPNENILKVDSPPRHNWLLAGF